MERITASVIPVFTGMTGERMGMTWRSYGSRVRIKNDEAALMRLGDTVDEPTSSAQDVVKAAGPFVHPETLALIGATSRGDKVGNRILQYLAGWQGRLFLVSRNESEIMGRPACRDIADLPDSIDLAVIAVEARKAVEAAKRCADKNFRAVIIPASGFSETGTEGERLEEELRQRVSAKGTRVLGPNTLGVFIPGTGLDTVFVEHGDRMFAEPGESVFITQSGSVGIEALGVSGVIGWGLKAFIGQTGSTWVRTNSSNTLPATIRRAP